MIKDLFLMQKNYIDDFFEKIDIEKTEKILKAFLNCKGTIIFTGIGKSGIIANKLANTMISTGTKAIYLSAVDALHGDIGIVSKEDIVVFLSKSGDTKELVSLVPYIKQKKAKTIAIISKKDSKLTKLSDLSICLPGDREICPFNLAPTTSTTLQLIFGDVLTVAMMKNKKFSIKEYATNHPLGSIGKQIALKVKDLMLIEKDVPFCKEDDCLLDVLYILSEKKCGCLIVIDEKKFLKGIFTDGDLRRAIEKDKKNFLKTKIKDLMTKNPKFTTEDTLVIDAMKKMEEGKLVTMLPVLKNAKIIGIIRMHDIVQEGLK